METESTSAEALNCKDCDRSIASPIAAKARRKRMEIRRFKKFSIRIGGQKRARLVISSASVCDLCFNSTEGPNGFGGPAGKEQTLDPCPAAELSGADVQTVGSGNRHGHGHMLMRAERYPLDSGKCVHHICKASRNDGDFGQETRAGHGHNASILEDCVQDETSEIRLQVEKMKSVEPCNIKRNAQENVVAVNKLQLSEQSSGNVMHVAMSAPYATLSTIASEGLTSRQGQRHLCLSSAKVLICGRRREMEDSAVIAPAFAKIPCDVSGDCFCKDKQESVDQHFFAVYDGHGGNHASNYCAERLHHVLAQELESPSFRQSADEGSSTRWGRVMSSCFLKMDKEIGGLCPFGLCDDVERPATCCANTIAPENVGTTAVVVVVNSCEIVVANCGDSRAVLSKGGKAISLSRDHKPERSDEMARIEAAGGRVICWDGHRVGALLAVSRSIGDRYLKRYVISEPEVTCLKRTVEDECLIIASDGLWDVMSNDTACDIVRKYLGSTRRRGGPRMSPPGEDPVLSSVAAILVKLAYSRGSKDNISVVVVDLKF